MRNDGDKSPTETELWKKHLHHLKEGDNPLKTPSKMEPTELSKIQEMLLGKIPETSASNPEIETTTKRTVSPRGCC